MYELISATRAEFLRSLKLSVDFLQEELTPSQKRSRFRASDSLCDANKGYQFSCVHAGHEGDDYHASLQHAQQVKPNAGRRMSIHGYDDAESGTMFSCVVWL
jgi:hypothetical protein